MGLRFKPWVTERLCTQAYTKAGLAGGTGPGGSTVKYGMTKEGKLGMADGRHTDDGGAQDRGLE